MAINVTVLPECPTNTAGKTYNIALPIYSYSIFGFGSGLALGTAQCQYSWCNWEAKCNNGPSVQDIQYIVGYCYAQPFNWQ